MQAIQNQAIETYLENLEYFKNNHPDLYKRINMLSGAIDNEQYKERYHLDYVQEDNEFDILDTHNETYLYNRKPKKFIEIAVQNSNLDKENSIDLLHPEIYNIKQNLDIDKYETIEFKTQAQVQNDIFEYTKIFQKSTLNPNKKFLQIEKFIFVGTLLGRHIEAIALKLKSLLLFIFEKNLEIFRLSLFTTNYATIAHKHNKVMIFSIMEDENREFSKLKKFYGYEVYSNHLLKYYSTNYNIGNFFDTILTVSKTQSPFGFNYEKMIDGLIVPITNNILHYPILDTTYNYTLFTDIPVLFIAAGPSLGRNIEWVKKHQSKYYIVAVGAAIKTLIASDIIPDLITSADADEIIINQFPLEIRDKLQDIPFLTSSSTFKDVLSIFPRKNIILYELMCLIKTTSEPLKGYSVGEITLRLLTILGANDIYMIGTDMALDQETGASHIKSHDELKTHEVSEDQKEENYFMKNNESTMIESTIVVKGNFRHQVITTTSFIDSINAYKYNMKIIKQNNPEIKIFNLNDGAYLEGITPLKIEEVVIPKEDKKDIDIKEKLLSYSTLEINQEDIGDIKDTILIVNTLLSNIKKLKKLKLKSYQEFRDKRGQILTIIHHKFSQYADLYAGIIFNRYYLTMEAYLGFQFNEKVSNEKELINKVKIVWCDQLLRLASSYKMNISQLTKT